MFVHSRQWYADQQVELVTGTAATDIDLDRRSRRRRATDSGPTTGCSSPPEPHRGASRSLTSPALTSSICAPSTTPTRLSARLGEHLLIVGAGWIGLEVAAAARQADGAVTVVETAALPLARVLGPEVAPVFADLHRDHGVDLRLNTSVETIEHTPNGTIARLSDGHEVSPDLILVGIGAEPDIKLGANAGLVIDHGIVVDAYLRASDPHVYAAGDVATHDHPTLGRIRVEHWDTAIHQGQHAARSMLGHDAPYARQPYFFTDQYDLGMEYVGHVGPAGYDEVVIRGNPAERVFTALWIKGSRVVAGMHVNDWDAIDTLRNLVGNEADRLAQDPDVALLDIPAATPVSRDIHP